MPRSGANINLRNLDDIFSTAEEREEAKLEKVWQIPLKDLYPFKDHPFQVRDDEEMQKVVDSVKEYGVVTPAIARRRPEGGYELISGHRRHHAAELAGLETMPVIVRNLDDDAAVILMVDANLQREQILPSEKAKAYKMKLEAIKHQGQRRDLTSGQVVQKFKTSVEQVASDAGENYKQVQRYIRLTELIPEIQEMVDDGQMALNPAVEVSYLKPEEQKGLLGAMDYGQATPSLSQAQRMKNLSRAGLCTTEAMCAVMSEDKKKDVDRVVIKKEAIERYFPKSYTPLQMEETIIKLLDQWQKKRTREQGQDR
ncbi:ParB/RepB/Spo0J family partition protein [Bacillota bacterium LCP21S3_D9]|nr:ParB/RepB/Spo0J family partition protein [Bacillota bacterium]